MRPNATRVPCVCEICGKPFTLLACEIKCGRGRFCSRACQGISKRVTPESFWARVDRSGGPDACWPWRGAFSGNGYGTVKWERKQQGAHRVAYILAHGPIADDVLIRHKVCDNPPCCNPAHLKPGDHLANHADMDEKGRRNAPRGERSLSPLTEADVRAIRHARAEGVPLLTLAHRHGISISSISAIALGKTWKHVVDS
jgi:hypothetical protein